jgi:long-chain acyl-CoA synthetase
VDGPYRLTRPEVDNRVNRLANALLGAGVGEGDRILWLGQNSCRVYELLLAGPGDR